MIQLYFYSDRTLSFAILFFFFKNFLYLYFETENTAYVLYKMQIKSLYKFPMITSLIILRTHIKPRIFNVSPYFLNFSI
jgi:hypothetical protein